jgi:uncharacterized protein
MTKLAAAVTMAIVEEYGPGEMLQRLADPWWFQAFGCALGFDWHSSGVTTVTCGALKEAAKTCGRDLGLLVAGGKGATSRKTPEEIAAAAAREAITGGEQLIYASRMSAKVDSAAVQDGFQIYHHAFFFTPAGQWCVVQQGLNEASGWARRYHWLGERVDDFVCEPHAAIQNLAGEEEPLAPARSADPHPSAAPPTPRPGPRQLELFPDVESPPVQDSESGAGATRAADLLNMVAAEAEANRNASAALVREHPDWLRQELQRCTEGPTLFAPARHPVLKLDVNWRRLNQLLVNVHEHQPQDFETLLGLRGVGPATVRSLALLAELIFQAPASHRDPACSPNGPPASSPEARRWADYSYAHGGKDGTPFPVDRATYDRNIFVLTDAVRRARVGENDKFHALRRLGQMSGDAGGGQRR